MCGIAGELRHDGAPVDREALGRAARSIAHRGPDDEGIHLDGPVGLAHRRLSIIDLSESGHQPMSNEDGTVWLTYNGEIYNFRELRRLLEARGHRFASHTDSRGARPRLRGVGREAAAIASTESSRSRSGTAASAGSCSLATASAPSRCICVGSRDRLLFGSEIKAILALAGEPARLSFTLAGAVHELPEHVRRGDAVRGRDDVAPRAPGCVVREDGTATRGVYYDPIPCRRADAWQRSHSPRRSERRSSAPSIASSCPTCPSARTCRAGWTRRRWSCSRGERIPHIHTFTAGFDVSDASPLEVAADERPDAEVVARDVGTEHYGVVLHAGDMARVLPDLVWHLEDLRAGHLLPELLRGPAGVEVRQGRDGRDRRRRAVRRLPVALRDAGRRSDRAGFLDAYYRYWCRLLGDADRREAFTDEAWARPTASDPRAASSRSPRTSIRRLDPVEQALYFEQRTFLHGLLVVEDKMSMAHSMEARVPFLDNELVDFALRIPARVRAGSDEGKVLLRQAARSFLPDVLVRKRKQGFSPPDGTWYRGRNLEYVRDVLLDPGSLRRGIFRPDFLERVISRARRRSRRPPPDDLVAAVPGVVAAAVRRHQPAAAAATASCQRGEAPV